MRAYLTRPSAIHLPKNSNENMLKKTISTKFFSISACGMSASAQSGSRDVSTIPKDTQAVEHMS